MAKIMLLNAIYLPQSNQPNWKVTKSKRKLHLPK